MKNERGVSLVESLAVIILLSMVSILLFSIMTSGMKNFERTSTKQRLQQEGNYITEVVRNEYLKLGTPNIELTLNAEKTELSMNGSVISSGFSYTLTSPSTTFNRKAPMDLKLTITEKGQSYEINTTLTKLY